MGLANPEVPLGSTDIGLGLGHTAFTVASLPRPQFSHL